MPRLIALACLLAALATVGLASPGGGVPVEDKKDPTKVIPPTLLSPMPGDVVGSSVVVTGVSTCKPVMLTWTPPGTTVEVPVDPAPDNTWTYTITGVTTDIAIKVCCKKATPPHGPCVNLTNVKHTPDIGLPTAAPGTTPATAPNVTAAVSPGIPTFKPGRIPLTGKFAYDQHAGQTVYVYLENAVLTDPKCHRSQTAVAELNAAATPAEWRACFANVGPGLYLVRWLVVSRGAAPVPGSYVIKVAW